MHRSVALFVLFLAAMVTFSTTGCRKRGGVSTTVCDTNSDCQDATPFCTPDGVCVECFETTQCDCHEQCLDSVCMPLGASQANQNLNAHGNWTGAPGQSNYEFRDSCSDNSDCGIGQICNPHTAGCVMAVQFTTDCNPDDANDCPVGPNGETLICEPTSQKCMPAPSCIDTYNCCGQESLICDSSAQVCLGIADECTPPTEITTSCPLEPRNQDSCLPGYFCSLAGFCVQCTCDADCNLSGATDLKCHLPTHTCKSTDHCDTPSDCDQPVESCDTQNNICAPSCSVEDELTDCGINFFCDPQDNVCRSMADLPCSEDQHTPNQTPLEASPLSLPDVGSNHSVTNLSVCNGDDDWFAISMEAGNRLLITMSSPNPSMTATYSIFSSDGETQLAQGLLNPGGSQLLDFTANNTSEYLLKVDPTGDSEGWYNLSLAMHQGELCEDTFESNASNDNAETATLLLNESTSTKPEACLLESTPNTSFVRCSSTVLTLCLGEVDYYELVVSQSSRLEVTIKDYLGDLDVVVYGPFADSEAFDSSRIVGGQNLGPALVKTVETIARNSSRYFVKVSGGPGVESAYTLETRVNHIDSCIEDSFDAGESTNTHDPDGQNDSAATASGIALTNNVLIESAGSLCIGDSDWFKLGIDNESGELVQIPTGHRIELELVTSNEDAQQAITMAVGTSTNGVEFGSLDPTAPVGSIAILLGEQDDYFVTIVGATSNTSVVDYTLRTTLIAPPSCSADNNDSPSNATALIAPEHVGDVVSYGGDSSSCIGEDDWYTVTIPDNTQLIATVAYDPNITDLGLGLFDSNVVEITSNTEGTFPIAGELARSTVPGRRFQQIRKSFTGSGYLVVSNQGSWNLSDYDLTLELIPTECTEDSHTPNQSSAQAALISLSQDPHNVQLDVARVEPLSICDGLNDDWFKVVLLNNDRLNASAYFDESDGGLNLKLYRPFTLSTPIDSDDEDTQSGGAVSVGTIVEGDNFPGAYLLKVEPNESTPYYNLSVEVVRSCIDDALENGPAAFVIGVEQMPFNHSALVLCNDSDVFSIQVPDGNTVSIDATFSHTNGDIELELFADSALTVLLEDRTSNTDNEHLTYTNTSGDNQAYYLRVTLNPNIIANTEYSLAITTTP